MYLIPADFLDEWFRKFCFREKYFSVFNVLAGIVTELSDVKLRHFGLCAPCFDVTLIWLQEDDDSLTNMSDDNRNNLSG